jgi:hypothetical protein
MLRCTAIVSGPLGYTALATHGAVCGLETPPAIRFTSFIFLLHVFPALNWLSLAAVPSSEHGIGAQLPDRQVKGSGDGDQEPDDQLLGAEETVRF